MWNLFYLALFAAAGTPVEVRPVSGPDLRGSLVEFSPDAITLQTDDGQQRMELATLWEIGFQAQPLNDERPPEAWLELTDGSVIQAAQVTVSADMAKVQFTNGVALPVKTRNIHSIRFRSYESTPQLAGQWEDIASVRPTSDLVVIRREAGLDQLEGRLHDISDAVVQFEFNGQTIDAKRSKLDGVVYYHPIADSLPERLAQLVDVAGSTWNVRSISMAEDHFDLVTVAGVKLTLPVERVRRIDFSSGNTVWLDDLQPSVDWQPFVGSVLPHDRLAKLFAPRIGTGFDGDPLQLGGQIFERGLAIWSRTELTYRLTDEYRRFHALVGIADAYRGGGSVLLTISGDDRELFSQTITGRDAPQTLDLDISGVRRLKILVDFGGERDMRDHLNLCDARITK